MKRLFVTSAAVAALIATPAIAQVVIPPPAATPDVAVEAESQTQGELKIEGVEPSRVLGAIDTSKLVDGEQPPEAGAEATAEAEIEAEIDTEIAADSTAETELAASSDIEVSGELPAEVAEVVADGSYSTEDLVTAQLAAVQNSPVAGETVTSTTITTPDAEESSATEDDEG